MCVRVRGCFPGLKEGAKCVTRQATTRRGLRLEQRQGERVHASRVHAVTYVRACARVFSVHGGGARVQRVALCHNVAVCAGRVCAPLDRGQ